MERAQTSLRHFDGIVIYNSPFLEFTHAEFLNENLNSPLYFTIASCIESIQIASEAMLQKGVVH